jgi:hypothetical protein
VAGCQDSTLYNPQPFEAYEERFLKNKFPWAAAATFDTLARAAMCRETEYEKSEP